MASSTPQYIANQQYTNAWWSGLADSVYSAIEIAESQPLAIPSSYDLPPVQYACPEFIKFLSSTQLRRRAHLLDWSYEQRRTAQDILPFLYLGPATITRDKDFLVKEGITLLLAIRDRNRVQALTVNGEKSAAILGIDSDFLEVSNTQELISEIPNVIRRINSHLCPCAAHQPSGGKARKVLVFCDTGNEKSACVVAAYIMAMLQTRATAAASHVQVRRLCTNIGSTFDILKSFETILDAQRVIARNTVDHQSQSGGLESNHQVSRKRSFQVAQKSQLADGEAMDIDLSQEIGDYPSRPSHPPFRDLTR
ncbi:hypothetical protein McanMca71_005041 [Microsporum canis]|uniref:FMI2 protein n=1 Tax=Arthroderma otae (strain ATCC MYA-4605 / CBS 113480) TaxID=554155 RepID=C5FWG8_ARTOC|nr:FMI2 protein [Microsporum canis CBS 113480]EEQ34252.1 FMI2 protein [Microsporum canis CBS 113480]